MTVIKWPDVETEIREQLQEYEVIVETEDGCEGYHTLTDMERYYTESFVSDVITERDMLRRMVKAQQYLEGVRISDGCCPGCGHKADGEHWGDCDGLRLLDSPETEGDSNQ